MTGQQGNDVDALMRATALDLGGDVGQIRTRFADFVGSLPLPPDVRTRDDTVGGVAVVEVQVDGPPTTGTLLDFHGGA